MGLNELLNDPLGFLAFMLYRAPAVLLALSLHELAHGYLALRAGDTTARDLGRLTMNPLRHLDPVGTASMFLLGVGWAKPVPVNPARFRNGRWDDLKVSLAGVTANFLLFLLSTLMTLLLSRVLYRPEVLSSGGARALLGFDYSLQGLSNIHLFLFIRTNQVLPFDAQFFPQFTQNVQILLQTPWLLHIQRFLFQLAMVNLGMGLFNLLPIPPLDGFHVANDVLFKGKLDLSGNAFRIAQFALLVLLFTTDFIGRWITVAIYAVQGAVLGLLLPLFGL